MPVGHRARKKRKCRASMLLCPRRKCFVGIQSRGRPCVRKLISCKLCSLAFRSEIETHPRDSAAKKQRRCRNHQAWMISNFCNEINQIRIIGCCVTMRRKYRTELRHEHVQFRILLTNVNTTADSTLAESGSAPRSGGLSLALN